MVYLVHTKPNKSFVWGIIVLSIPNFDGNLESYYFRNTEHALNFMQTLLMWPEVRSDCQYRAASYILSVPMIYAKVCKYTSEKPTDWIMQWETAYNEDFRKENGINEKYEVPFTLSSSMVQLGRLALNLFDGYEHFNLMDCLSSVDEHNYKVVKCAMDIRSKVI
ncbi:MAG: DUF2538 family protein [Kurthia sp.]|nr:DUF2538 family protein [Candidatus Kurthia equi]